jgi:hypothetical protein
MSHSGKTETEHVLETFAKIATDLQCLFRARQPLTADQQLFIENRIMMLQLEYKLWMHRDRIRLRSFDFPATTFDLYVSPDKDDGNKN